VMTRAEVDAGDRASNTHPLPHSEA
jgi:hypothetical protein